LGRVESLNGRVLAFVDLFVESMLIDDVVRELKALDKVLQVYEVTGEFDVVTLIGADNIEDLRDILKNRILKIRGIKSTVSSIVLKIDKAEPLNPE
jgi:DNA-binding Lrp family transcriptional regulator